MCNLSWTPHSSLEKDNSLNHSYVSQKLGCFGVYTTKNLSGSDIELNSVQHILPFTQSIIDICVYHAQREVALSTLAIHALAMLSVPITLPWPFKVITSMRTRFQQSLQTCFRSGLLTTNLYRAWNALPTLIPTHADAEQFPAFEELITHVRAYSIWTYALPSHPP